MSEFFAHYAGPAMFGGLLLFMMIGYPAAFSLAAVGLFFGLAAIQFGVMDASFLGNLIYQVAGPSVLGNDLLLAIPFFTFMGAILERSGLTEDMLEGFGHCLAHCVAASPTPSFSSARSWARSPGRLRLGHRHGPHLAADHAEIWLTRSGTPRASLRRPALSPN